VIEIPHSSRCDDWNAHGFRQTARFFNVGACLHAITVDIGKDDCGHPCIFQPGGEVHGLNISGMSPSMSGDPAVAGIDCHGYPTGVGSTGIPDELRVLNSGRAEDHPMGPALQIGVHGTMSPYAATHLDWNASRCHDTTDAGLMPRFSLNRRIQVDNVQQFGSGSGPAPGHRFRIIRENGLLLQLPLD
jgi:hypothetical protein